VRQRQSRNPVIDERKRLYGTRRWKTLRARVLKSNPKCWRCSGKATSVDHIRHDDRNAMFFEVSNLRPCCIACNSELAAAGRREARLRAGGAVSQLGRGVSTPMPPIAQNIGGRNTHFAHPRKLQNTSLSIAEKLLAKPRNLPSNGDDRP